MRSRSTATSAARTVASGDDGGYRGLAFCALAFCWGSNRAKQCHPTRRLSPRSHEESPSAEIDHLECAVPQFWMRLKKRRIHSESLPVANPRRRRTVRFQLRHEVYHACDNDRS